MFGARMSSRRETVTSSSESSLTIMSEITTITALLVIDDPFYKKPLLIIAIIWVAILAAVFLTWIASRIFRTKLSMIYDMCTDYEAVYFYSFKINFGKLPSAFVKGEKSFRMDIINRVKEHITRIDVPLTQTYSSKKNTMTTTFKIARSKKMPLVEYFRLDHNMFGAPVFVNYVEMKDLNEDGRNNVTAKIQTAIKTLAPSANLEDYRTQQVFAVTGKDPRVGGGDTDGSRSRLSSTEIVIFFGFSTQVIMLTSLYQPKPMTSILKFEESYSNGLIAGGLAIFITFWLQIIYKMVFKRNTLPFGWKSYLNSVFLILILLASIGITAQNGVVLSDDKQEPIDTILWMTAVGIGVGLYILIGLPLTFGCEVIAQRITMKAATAIHEETAVNSGFLILVNDDYKSGYLNESSV